MADQAKVRKPTRVPPTGNGSLTWEQMREMAESGTPLAELARTTRIPVAAISNKAHKDQWLTPIRRSILERKGNKFPQIPKGEGGKNTSGIVPSTLCDTLSQLAHASPGKYAENVAEFAANMVMRAMPHMPMPRTVKDLNTWDQIARRGWGLDKQTTKVTTLFNPTSGMMGMSLEMSGGPEEPDDE